LDFVVPRNSVKMGSECCRLNRDESFLKNDLGGVYHKYNSKYTNNYYMDSSYDSPTNLYEIHNPFNTSMYSGKNTYEKDYVISMTPGSYNKYGTSSTTHSNDKKSSPRHV